MAKSSSSKRPKGSRFRAVVVKRLGHNEKYDERKVYASVYAACLNCSYTEHLAETQAEKVVGHVNRWIATKREVTSHDIMVQIITHLDDAHVAMMYREHLDVC